MNAVTVTDNSFFGFKGPLFGKGLKLTGSQLAGASNAVSVASLVVDLSANFESGAITVDHLTINAAGSVLVNGAVVRKVSQG